jgi:hypothetical protein
MYDASEFFKLTRKIVLEKKKKKKRSSMSHTRFCKLGILTYLKIY